MYFLQNWLEAVELVHNFNGYIWWWIGLNDIEEEGKYVWPVNGPVNYTHWDEEYIYDGEPYDYYGNYDCVEMQSAELYSLLWLAMECDDTQANMSMMSDSSLIGKSESENTNQCTRPSTADATDLFRKHCSFWKLLKPPDFLVGLKLVYSVVYSVYQNANSKLDQVQIFVFSDSGLPMSVLKIK